MARRLTRAEQQARTRRRLLEVAAKLFADHGYQATSLEQIAEKAGLTKGAVYSNFTSKADLALAVLDELALGSKLDVFTEVDDGALFEDQHVHGGKLLTEAIDRSTLWFQVELQCILHAQRDPELKEKMARRDASLRSALASSIEARMGAAGWVPKYDIDQILSALIAVGSGVALQRLKDPERVPIELAGQLIAAVYDYFAVPVERSKTRARRRGPS
jgi:AcrR family transcriptional regulator